MSDNKESIQQLTDRNTAWRAELRKAIATPQRTAIPRVRMTELDPAYRITNSEEVAQGLTAEQALVEASRCLDCPNPTCVTGCPVNINIPSFIKNIQREHFGDAARVLRDTSALPAVCGRVCPQERQCESRCIYHKMKKEPIAIGWLERFASDAARRNDKGEHKTTKPATDAPRIAVAGSGPSGLSFAGAMAALGYRVTVFEALHEIGGVLKYGIPEFRLPNEIVDYEIANLRAAGVEFHTDTVIGKTLSYDDLKAQGFVGLFVASGAGLPRFMGIPGENLIGIMSSNEYLTRINLMGAGRPGYATPVRHGHTVAVIGGGNTAMDSVRTALRMGAERAVIVYRRGLEEMPARAEEIHHAQQEGVEFMTLHNPVEYRGDEHGQVTTMILQPMRLGQPDASGRRSPEPDPDKALIEMPVDEVIVSVGVSPNPLIPHSIPALDTTRRGTIAVGANSGEDGNDGLQSSIPTIFAGGDIVRGGATVILAMGDGRRAAAQMHAYLTAQKA